ncbi:MAG: MBL fold metallo-hydrolase [Chloroflexi bacterium]|nr:MBL fold metallo-hydrolase [Chloroflexota bacterium]MBU1747234.1 MBL fold metallo-hydrolase [Chloroflexota bacterium]
MGRLPTSNRTILAISLLLVAATLLLSSLAYGSPADTLQVTYLDVGQGDSIWLHATDGTDVLIDGGPVAAGPSVVAYLQDQGLDDIEVLVLTHGDADHVGGLIAVLRSTIPVDQVLYNGLDHTTATYASFLAELQTRGLTPVPAQAGQTYAWGPLDATVLNPQVPGTGDQNEDSVVLAVAYGAVRWLFTGDIGSATEQTILLSDTLRAGAAADVLKVAHHGSRYSSSAPFLAAVGAELAVICVGADNPYGHPAAETLARLQAAGARIMRTDHNGTIIIHTEGQTFQVEPHYWVFLPLVARQWPPLPDAPVQDPSATPRPLSAATPSAATTATAGP